MKRVFSLFLAVLSLLLVTAGLFFFLTAQRDSLTPDVADIREEVSALQTLTAGEYRYRDVVYYSEETRLLGIPAGRREILFSLDIVVRGGVDLSRGFQVETDETGERLFLTVPAAEILLVDADEDSIEQYFAAERLGRIDWLDVGDELTRAKEANRADAIERGILSATEAQARSVLSDLGRAAGFETVEIRFRPAAEIRG